MTDAYKEYLQKHAKCKGEICKMAEKIDGADLEQAEKLSERLAKIGKVMYYEKEANP